MTQAGTGRAEPPNQSMGLGSNAHSGSQRLWAAALCLSLAGITLLAVRFGTAQGPELKPFLPIVATAWALADLMTAFLLLAQFYVNGTKVFTTLAAAYALSGLLTWPYLIASPGLFRTGALPLPDQQISVWIWLLWHATFPLIVSAGVIWDPKLKLRTFSRRATRHIVRLTALGTFGLAALLTALAVTQRAALPTIVRAGHFQALFTHVLAPGIALLNGVGCVLLLRRGRSITTLQLWLFVALFTALLDSLLNSLSPSRYSYRWYVGKLETVVTASVVLTMLLSEVTGLYRRLAEMATIDMLTQLFNRRALEDHMRRVLRHSKRQSSGLALLIVDVDFFKGYNDCYGHAEGDECLRRIAALLKSAATRPLDLCARYGGEEFVVVLPDTLRWGAVTVARRILTLVETAAIPHAAYALGHVTVSAGVAHAVDARDVDGDELFALADRALYEAKARGRNTFVLEEYRPGSAKVVTLRVGDERKLFGT